ncbi:uncharacterized protein TNCV_3256851 [Trichonephila clavipes]|nr:uncharacterized protein TNCV_3256851 [Trichonephila clavipes]
MNSGTSVINNGTDWESITSGSCTRGRIVEHNICKEKMAQPVMQSEILKMAMQLVQEGVAFFKHKNNNNYRTVFFGSEEEVPTKNYAEQKYHVLVRAASEKIREHCLWVCIVRCSDEAHFWLNGYVNKQNCRIWREANPQVYVETPLHPEKLTVWCALWAGGILLQKR